MANDSDIDSWKTEPSSDSNLQSDRKDSPNSRRRVVSTLVDDRRAQPDRICEDAVRYRARVRNSKSGPEIRYINPAIYTEFMDEEEHRSVATISQNQSEPDSQRKECYSEKVINANHGDTAIAKVDLSAVGPAAANAAKNVDHESKHSATGRSTYRCYSTSLSDTALPLEPSTARSVVVPAVAMQVERRCKIGGTSKNQSEAVKRENKYAQDNRQVVRISATTSLSSMNTEGADCEISNGPNLARRIAHAEWVRRKQEAAQRKRGEEERAAKNRQQEEQEIARQKEEKARLEKENFIKWVERKRRQELDRKAMLETELELQRRLKEIEDKAAVAKTLYLRQWVHKKREEEKTRHKERETRQRKMNEEREKRLEQSSKAYEKWREDSKNRPKPATQGLLPHQTAKPTYVNPIPWRSIVETDSDEAQENAFDDEKANANRMSDVASIAAHQ